MQERYLRALIFIYLFYRTNEDLDDEIIHLSTRFVRIYQAKIYNWKEYDVLLNKLVWDLLCLFREIRNFSENYMA